MKLIGLTGGIACGKSTVLKILKEKFDVKYIDADVVAKEISEPDMVLYNAYVEEFGQEFVNADRTLNRRALRVEVFADKSKLQRLDMITRQSIKDDIIRRVEEYKAAGEKLVFLDAALLIETELNKICDDVWVVVADKKMQLERIVSRDKIPYNVATNMMGMQLSHDVRCSYATDVITNTGTIEELETAVSDLYNKALQER